MKVLILGGTRFQGKFLTKKLLERGYEVTLFHKGTHAADPLPVEDITGNRDNPQDLEKLRGRRFDWIIDTCAYLPRQIRSAILCTGENAENYCFISTSYVYSTVAAPNPAAEDAPRESLPEGADANVFDAANYGALKALCEDELDHFKGRKLVLRPCIITGPSDHTGRFAFWVRLIHRLKAGILPREGKIQLIDVRDLVEFTVNCIDSQKQGPVNVAAPDVSLASMLKSIAEVVPGASARVRSIAEIRADQLRTPLPLADETRMILTKRAQEWGLTTRPISATARDVLEFEISRGLPAYPFSELEAQVISQLS